MAPQYSAQPDFLLDLDKSYGATLHTNHGGIAIELNASRSPIAVNNFVFLSRDGFYDGVIFHRVVPGFVIQAGDPEGTGTGGPGYRFRDEIEGQGSYTRGTLAMANSGPNTNGSQFFICLGDAGLPHKYTIFGTVTDGMDSVDAIAGTPLSAERPVSECVIERVTITET